MRTRQHCWRNWLQGLWPGNSAVQSVK
jgi:hypothetical protein